MWYIEGSKRLKEKFISEIDNPGNLIYISKASLWEMVIKISLGKLEISIPFDKLEAFLRENEFNVIDYNFKHLHTLMSLPFHHSDPFDRLIISQAIADNMTVITQDKMFKNYPVEIL